MGAIHRCVPDRTLGALAWSRGVGPVELVGFEFDAVTQEQRPGHYSPPKRSLRNRHPTALRHETHGHKNSDSPHRRSGRTDHHRPFSSPTRCGTDRLSILLTEVMTIADEIDSQLSQAMTSYIAESVGETRCPLSCLNTKTRAGYWASWP